MIPREIFWFCLFPMYDNLWRFFFWHSTRVFVCFPSRDCIANPSQVLDAVGDNCTMRKQ